MHALTQDYIEIAAVITIDFIIDVNLNIVVAYFDAPNVQKMA